MGRGNWRTERRNRRRGRRDRGTWELDNGEEGHRDGELEKGEEGQRNVETGEMRGRTEGRGNWRMKRRDSTEGGGNCRMRRKNIGSCRCEL